MRPMLAATLHGGLNIGDQGAKGEVSQQKQQALNTGNTQDFIFYLRLLQLNPPTTAPKIFEIHKMTCQFQNPWIPFPKSFPTFAFLLETNPQNSY
jgi:hypothetical protein